MATDGESKTLKATSRFDYVPPAFLAPETDIKVDLAEPDTRVSAFMQLTRNAAFVERTGESAKDLILDGRTDSMTLQRVEINGEVIPAESYKVEEQRLVIDASVVPQDDFTLRTVVTQRPQDNTEFMGLYKTGGNYMTQMEAMGFRKFAYHFDRPDVMSIYNVTVSAPKDYPVLLSNGVTVEQGEGNPTQTEDKHPTREGDAIDAAGRHWASFEDPWPKPSYLFAIVVCNYAKLEGTFTTKSGREVQLAVYAPERDIGKCDHAIRSLQRSFKWDEEAYGREYDNDVFSIVVSPDFNMGAMENKALNIFNTKYVLADARTATDTDFANVEGVVGHEYFHNWSGNRVTCRDWFQLSLKEGFTVFRDQSFSAAMGSPAIKRIDDVNVLRASQFQEDGGPMSHPIRPDSFVTINNFYTSTVYNKGAEIVGMYNTILGAENYRAGTDLYFDRHDGEAVTCDDFATAHEEANWSDLPPLDEGKRFERRPDGEWVDPMFAGERPLTQFRRWYAVAGTPSVEVDTAFDAEAKTYTLTMKQSVPRTATQDVAKPALHIPVRVGLLDKATGQPLNLQLRADPASWAQRWGSRMNGVAAGAAAGGEGAATDEVVLHLTEPMQSFVFENVAAEPVPSILRNFSAPVNLKVNEPRENPVFRMAHDPDAFNRWDSANDLATSVILAGVANAHTKEERLIKEARENPPSAEPAEVEALHAALVAILDKVAIGGSGDVDPALAALILQMPPLSTLRQAVSARDGSVDPSAVASAKTRVRAGVAAALSGPLRSCLQRASEALKAKGAYSLDQESIALRHFRNSVLGLLVQPLKEGAPEGLAPAVVTDGFDPVAFAKAQIETADNMTDEIAGLGALAALPAGNAERDAGLQAFYAKWQDEPLVIDKWLRTQALSCSPQGLSALLEHPAFDANNPNKIYSSVAAFAFGNPSFHDPSGAGYDVVASFLTSLDARNPQVAARIAKGFSGARSVAPYLLPVLRERVERMSAADKVSSDMGEVLAATMQSIVAREEQEK